MLELLTRRKRLLEAECAAAHHRLLYEFLSHLHRHRTDQLENLARETHLVRKVTATHTNITGALTKELLSSLQNSRASLRCV